MSDDSIREYPEWIVPHADHGDPDCCGLIFPDVRADEADLVCNECGFVLQTVPLADVDRAMLEMSAGEMCSAACSHCGMLNVFLGFSAMLAFTCRHCGAGVQVRRRYSHRRRIR